MSSFGASMEGLLAGAAFMTLLIGACVADLRSRRIPNGVVAALLAGGIWYTLATMPAPTAFAHSLGGALVGLAVWLPFWMLRALGAGDVKLAAAAGAWLGVGGVLEASAVAAVAGGALAIWALARNGGIGAATVRFAAWLAASRSMGAVLPELTPREHRVPYGLAIATGAAVAAWIPNLVW